LRTTYDILADCTCALLEMEKYFCVSEQALKASHGEENSTKIERKWFSVFRMVNPKKLQC